MTFVETIKSLFENKIFLSTTTSLIVAQITKMVIFVAKRKKIPRTIWEIIETIIWRTGGMPSSHSAFVCALATSVGIKYEFSSDAFVCCLVLSMIVLRDAVGVRRATGIQAKALNTLGKQASEKIGVEFSSVKEIHGHTHLEVFLGALLGIAISILYYIL